MVFHTTTILDFELKLRAEGYFTLDFPAALYYKHKEKGKKRYRHKKGNAVSVMFR
jgi:hypothetical protein